MDLSNVITFVVSLAACFAAAGIGSLFTFKAIPGWYKGLKKPPYTPPNRAFGPVWTVLYLLMAVSVFLVWKDGLETNGELVAFALFWIQLAVNVLWSMVFFGLKSKGGGVIVIGILWLLIWATIISDFKVSVWAAVLLLPYIAWVSVATYLNVGIWTLNKQAKG